MDNPAPEFIVVIVAGALLFLGFLPPIVAATASRRTLMLAALLLSLIAIGLFSLGAVAGLAVQGWAVLFALPLAGACWFAGLFCGLAAFIDAAAERREAEMAFRLIYGDARGLAVPKDLRQPPPRVEPRP